MKGLILSGGTGTRLRPITHTSAKQLVPVANKPVIYYAIEAVKAAGIDEIGIIVGDTRDEIMAALGDGSNWGVRTTYIHQEQPLGLAHAVACAHEFLGDEEFVMFLGDNLIKEGIKSLVDEFRNNRPNAQILLAHVRNPSQFGVAELTDGVVTRLVEKPLDPPSDLALVGVYMFDDSIWEAIDGIEPSPRGEFEITDAIQYLIDHGKVVEPHIIDGWWKDTGKLEDMLEANRIILESFETRVLGKVDDRSEIFGRVVIEEDAEIVNSVIRGPAIIGKGTRVIDSFIGPFTSIYYDVLVEQSEIEHSIILESSCIRGVSRLEDSLIGKNVDVSRSGKKPSAYRLMLGDNSCVDLV